MFAGICLDKITRDFPMYPLDGKVTDDIHRECKQAGFNIDDLSNLPKEVGGQMDFIIGSKYMRYHPKEVHELFSGLSTLRSVFVDATGCHGIVCGPHEVFTATERFHGYTNGSYTTYTNTYFTEQFELLRKNRFDISDDAIMFNIKNEMMNLQNEVPSITDEFMNSDAFMSRNQKNFEAVEDAGTDTSYRCVSCRVCKMCKEGCKIESISFKEEVEQDIIDKSIKIDLKSQRVIAHLPLIENPVMKLAPNKKNALAVYRAEVKKLNNHPEEKREVIKSQNKLQELGFVDYVKNLPDAVQEMLRNSEIQNFIPWRVVWKAGSVSTPCRMVFDASQPTSSGNSLNDILPKGTNNLNSLLEIVLRWFTQVVALHCDVQKMYNTIRLHEDHWVFQRYIWDEKLDPVNIPSEKIIFTLIYGVKPSGNQAGVGLRETAKLSKEEFPDICEMVHEDVYVDDGLSGAPDIESAYKRADNLSVVLSKDGFKLKGFTFSGADPPNI